MTNPSSGHMWASSPVHNRPWLKLVQFDLLDQWTQFLVAESLIPQNQISTDDFAGSLANQTNLAIKGIVGIKAMAVICDMLGDTNKSSNYSVRRVSWTLI